MVIWLIGLSGAGKSTIGRRLFQRLKDTRDNIVFVDGDVVRELWGDSLGHDMDGRRQNAYRISHLCRFLDQQGIHVVVAVLSIFHEWQAWNRSNFSSYFEVFVDVPMEVLRERDPKGLYAKAFAGEISDVVGVDIPFPLPANSDLVLDNAATRLDPGELCEEILAGLPRLDSG